MIKLKKIILQLNKELYSQVQENIVKNKGDNFLFLLRSYRESDLTDEQVMEKLDISPNSLNVLKSRLYDKIQEELAGDIYSSKEEVQRLLHEIPERCYTTSREINTAFLLKLEKDLLHYDMHHELLVVYSALKKMHLYSDKYYHYSQLFNKHIAFSLSLEKSEEILGNFIRTLCEYDFSRSARSLDTLYFLSKEIGDHYQLNSSRQVEIIKNIIEIQLNIFCDAEKINGTNTGEMLVVTNRIIDELPDSFFGKSWKTPIDFLFFEYYKKAGRTKSELQYFGKMEENLPNLLLFSNVCITPQFLLSKIRLLQDLGQVEELQNCDRVELLSDPADTHANVIYNIYRAIALYFRNELKAATVQLNAILNDNSFKDLFHISLEVRLTLAFVYLQMEEYDMADNILKSVQRKIKAEEMSHYGHVLNLIKVFNDQMKTHNAKVIARQKDNFTLFLARNVKGHEVLRHILPELMKKYT